MLLVSNFWNFIVCECVSFSWLQTFNLCIIYFVRDHFDIFLICIRYIAIAACLILGCMCIKLCGSFLSPNFDERVLFSFDIRAFSPSKDWEENPCLSVASEAVGIFLKAEADDVAGATPEPVWEGVTLENDSSQTVC